MKKQIVILFYFILGFYNIASASEKDTLNPQAKNAIYGSVSTLGLWFTSSINYERHLFTTSNKLNVNYYLRVNYGGFSTWGASGPSTSLSLQGVLGKKKSHLELGLGFAGLFDKSGYDIGISNANYPFAGYEPEPSRWEYTMKLPSVTIGYRYQKPEGGFVFRSGISSPEGVYLSLGWAFGK